MKTIAASLLLAVVLPVHSQSMPSQADIDRKLGELRKQLPDQLDRAQQQAGVVKREVRPDTTPPVQRPASAGDPAALASRFSNDAARQVVKEDDRGAPVMVFVSLSMPRESLRRLAADSARAGVPMLFRGLKYGVGPGAVPRGLAELKPYVELGASILIDPEPFQAYSVDVVPAFIVAERPAGCSENGCQAGAAKVVGDVTLAYAMAQLTERTDGVGRLARDVAARLPRP
jgi:conjugal transfer pilus assembly protein TrbC